MKCHFCHIAISHKLISFKTDGSFKNGALAATFYGILNADCAKTEIAYDSYEPPIHKVPQRHMVLPDYLVVHMNHTLSQFWHNRQRNATEKN